MQLRPASPDDVPALLALQHAFDARWFGAPEHDADEVRELLDLADATQVAWAAGRAVAAAAAWRTGGQLVVDPAADVDAVQAALIPWLEAAGAPEVEALSLDERLRSGLEAHGWRYAHSAYDLLRPLPFDLPAPRLPDGVEFRALPAARLPELHRLIYLDAGWAEIPGHHHRDFAEWRSIFVDGRSEQERPVVAWRGDTPVAAAVVRRFSDGTGWIAQLAVSRGERRTGLGTATLLAAYHRLSALPGVTSLGLAVMATNPAALDLYLRVGLEIQREWRTYRPPRSAEPPVS